MTRELAVLPDGRLSRGGRAGAGVDRYVPSVVAVVTDDMEAQFVVRAALRPRSVFRD